MTTERTTERRTDAATQVQIHGRVSNKRVGGRKGAGSSKGRLPRQQILFFFSATPTGEGLDNIQTPFKVYMNGRKCSGLIG